MKTLSGFLKVLISSLLLISIFSCKKETIKVLPTVAISSVTNITSTSATYDAVVTSDGGAVVISRGICWSTTVPTPTTMDSKADNGAGKGSFANSLSTLNPGVTYYLRAYATNSVGTAYSDQLVFETLSLAPVLTTTDLTSVTSTTATSGGTITSDGGSAVLARGVCWATTENPTITGSKTTDGVSSGAFTSSITGLSPGSTYYIRAYATNNVGTSYGNQLTATTAAVLATVTTTDLSAITATTVSTGGTISTDGGSAVTARGVCWSITSNPTVSNSKTSDGTGVGSFTSAVTGLTAGTTYYIRAYATNTVGTVYGNQITTTTVATLPILTTAVASSITASTLSGGGTISSDGGSPVTARGICWSTSASPNISNSKTSDGTGTGSFISSLTSLAPGTVYHIRAYATNNTGTAYGNEVLATTAIVLPVLTTTDLTSVTATTATSGGTIISDGGSSISARGVCWSTSPYPTIANSKSTDGTGSGSFSSAIAGLTSGATYYIRAYATNGLGAAYGNQITITTTAALPVLTTTTVVEVSPTEVSTGGNITSDGGSAVLVRGVVWGPNATPSISDPLSSKTNDGVSSGSYTSSITGLILGGTYHIRAYATNNVGTAYGNEITITIVALLPTLSTTAATSITTSTLTSGGSVAADGGVAVTARGVCWSILANPTTADSKTSDGTGTGPFVSSVTGLSPSTTYYIRSYATNSVGTAYGAQITVTTLNLLPTLTTTAVSLITTTTASSGGNITLVGGSPVTARGVCWSTSTSPTILNSKTSDGSGIGTFTSAITGLSSGTIYYVRAYATNSTGTAYGTQFGFTTN